jgi:hypothetical protein
MVGRPLIRSRTKINNIEVKDVMIGDEGTDEHCCLAYALFLFC